MTIFSLYYFLPRNASKTTQGTPGKSRQVSAWLCMTVHTQPKAVVSHDTFPWWVSPCSQRNWWITSRDIDDQRILQSDWARAFRLILWELEFSQTLGLHGKTENYNDFYFRLLPAKSNHKIYENSIKIYLRPFGPFSPIFQKKSIFLENLLLLLLSF